VITAVQDVAVLSMIEEVGKKSRNEDDAAKIGVPRLHLRHHIRVPLRLMILEKNHTVQKLPGKI